MLEKMYLVLAAPLPEAHETKAVASRNPGIRPGRRPDRETLQTQAQEGSAHTAQATVLAH